MGLLPPPPDPVPITVFPQGDLPVGVVVSSPVTVPIQNDAVLISLARNAWPLTGSDVIAVRADLSLDGGLTWSPNPDGRASWPWGPFPIRCTSAGGVAAETVTTLAAVLPDPLNINRRTRITLDVKAPLNTAVTMLPITLANVVAPV